MHPQFVLFLVVFGILSVGAVLVVSMFLIMLIHAFNGMGLVSTKQLVFLLNLFNSLRFKRLFMIFSTVLSGFTSAVFFYYQNLIFHFWSFPKTVLIGSLYGVICGLIIGYIVPKLVSQMHAYFLQIPPQK